MQHKNRYLPLFLLSLTLAAPAVLPGTSTAEASVADKDNKDKKNKDKDKQRGNQHDDRGWNDDRDDWDGDGSMRFQGMDTNGDGRVTRSEWRGNAQSFANHDWNRDGVLAGDEVRPGGRGDRDDWEDDDWNNDRDGNWSDRFDRLDRNNDNYLSLSEWPRDRQLFDRLDLNDDRRLSQRELQNLFDDRGDRNGRREDQFRDLDENRDGRLSRWEWPGQADAFARLDDNRDRFLTLREWLGR
jgi:hypothetical protein